jgi:hypothetical protein
VPSESEQNDAHLSPQEDGQSPRPTLNRDAHPKPISVPHSRNSSNLDSLRHHSLERTSDIQGARSAEDVFPEAGNKETYTTADETDCLKIEDLVTSVSKPVASTQLDNSAADSLDGYNDTVWYLWYLSDKPPLESIAGKALLRIAVFLILVSTFGLVLFAISLQGFVIVPILDPHFFLIIVCVLLFYFEFLVICSKILTGSRAVRKEKSRQNIPNNEQGEAPADV